jgi:AraC family transcriptional regulator, regulatory protein of adaptative response / DNA-3-methyladenine glycosylase II
MAKRTAPRGEGSPTPRRAFVEQASVQSCSMQHHTVRLACKDQYDWTAAFTFLSRRAVAGVEQAERGVYRRAIQCADAAGILEVAHDAAGGALLVTVRGLPPAAAQHAIERVRHMFDLDADTAAIAAHLARDPSMAPLVTARPAIRVLRGWHGFEVAARSIIGQQVSVARARDLNGVLVDRCGATLAAIGDGALRRLFPTPQQVLDADLSAMGMPGARVAALKAIAAAALEDPRLFERSRSIDETIARLRAVHGVGDWTAHYIAMRACGEADAFPASDVGLLRGAADAIGRRPTPRALLDRAEAWRPWRSYAAHHLWACDSGARVRGSGLGARGWGLGIGARRDNGEFWREDD